MFCYKYFYFNWLINCPSVYRAMVSLPVQGLVCMISDSLPRELNEMYPALITACERIQLFILINRHGL